MTASLTAQPTASRILALVQSIERHGPDAPASLAFSNALRRAGQETDAIGGLAALEALADAVAAADPDRAAARVAIIRAAWAEVLPGLSGKRR